MQQKHYSPFKGKNQWPNMLIAVVGPTASGKTALAKALAERVSGYLLSADARQVYIGMDIGTNKEAILTKQSLPGDGPWGIGIDLVPPNEIYTAQQFQEEVYAHLSDVRRVKHTPILVGGTGQWVQAVIDAWKIPRVAPQPAMREQLQRRLKEEGLQTLASEALQRDPALRTTLDTDNPRRVIRALEVMQVTGRTFSEQQGTYTPPWSVCLLEPAYTQEALEARIEQRVDAMLQEGLVEEVQQLIVTYPRSTKAFSGIGYAETIRYLDGLTTRQAFREELIRNTRRYAKRQRSWWRRDSRVQTVQTVDEALAMYNRLRGTHKT